MSKENYNEEFYNLHKNLSYNFHAIYENKETKELLIKFMEQTQNSENFLFIELVNNFIIIKYPIAKRKAAEYIYETFIDSNGEKEINLPSKIKEEMKKKKEEAKGVYENEFFDIAYENVINDLIFDVFPRFQMTVEFKKLMEKVYIKIGEKDFVENFLLSKIDTIDYEKNKIKKGKQK
jgi:hypothetical protein